MLLHSFRPTIRLQNWFKVILSLQKVVCNLHIVVMTTSCNRDNSLCSSNLTQVSSTRPQLVLVPFTGHCELCEVQHFIREPALAGNHVGNRVKIHSTTESAYNNKLCICTALIWSVMRISLTAQMFVSPPLTAFCYAICDLFFFRIL